MANEIEKAFKATLDTVGETLDKAYENAISQEAENVKKKMGLVSLLNEINKLKNKIEQLEERKEGLQDKIDEGDKLMGWNYVEKWEKKHKIPHQLNRFIHYNVRESTLQAHLNLLNSKEAQNVIAWRSMRANYERMITMAVTSKEKRALLYDLHQYDWHSLGVDIPPAFKKENVSIKDGKICINALPNKN